MTNDTLRSIEDDYQDVAHAARLGHKKHVADVLALVGEVHRLRDVIVECHEAMDAAKKALTEAIAGAKGKATAAEVVAVRILVDAKKTESEAATTAPVTVAEVGA